jgi:hypothetical protein
MLTFVYLCLLQIVSKLLEISVTCERFIYQPSLKIPNSVPEEQPSIKRKKHKPFQLICVHCDKEIIGTVFMMHDKTFCSPDCRFEHYF